MSYKVYKCYNIDDFQKITRGIKLAKCMDSDNMNVKFELPTNLLQQDLTVSDTLICSFCNTKFDNQVQQRQHYKYDWHRYNLKQNLANRQPVTEEQFIKLTETDDLSSISGSDSEEEVFFKQKYDKIIDEIAHKSSSSSETSNKNSDQQMSQLPSRHTKVFFENENNEIFSVYKCLLHSKKKVPEKDNDLINLAQTISSKTTWAVVMLGGGHFAAAIFTGSEPIVHKTFHSYTVRAKQGGSQSSKDGRSGNSQSKSAGASLRRYNEASFMQHVQDIFDSWTSHLLKSDYIFYRAVGPHNRSVLFGGKSPPLNKTDIRLRPIPFPTRRATFGEVKRVHDVLSSVEVYGAAELFKEDFPQSPNKKEVQRDSISKINCEENVGSPNQNQQSTKVSSPDKPRKSRENSRNGVIDRAKSRELTKRPIPGQDVLKTNSSDSEGGELEFQNTEISFTETMREFEDTVPKEMRNSNKKKYKQKKKKKTFKESINDTFEVFKKSIWSAFDKKDSNLLESLLNTVENNRHSNDNNDISENNQVTNKQMYEFINSSIDSDGNTLLHLAAIQGNDEIVLTLMKFGSDPCNKNKKNQTPYAATTLKNIRTTFRKFLTDFPDKYNYQKSQIPGPIDEDLENQRTEKKIALKKIKREREKERRKKMETERLEQEERERFSKLSDREKRAIAAERRMINQNTKIVIVRCFMCGTDITGKVPFEYSNNTFCTIECLKAHRLSNTSMLH